MDNKVPVVSVDILVVQGNKVLLGLLSKKWLYEGEQVYGVPGREIYFRETIGEAVKRNIKDEIGCEVVNHTVFCKCQLCYGQPLYWGRGGCGDSRGGATSQERRLG